MIYRKNRLTKGLTQSAAWVKPTDLAQSGLGECITARAAPLSPTDGWWRVLKHNPYQNAHAEFFWSRSKAELLEVGCFETLQYARRGSMLRVHQLSYRPDGALPNQPDWYASPVILCKYLPANSLRKSFEAYCPPRSECKISPWAGFRPSNAPRKAVITNSSRM